MKLSAFSADTYMVIEYSRALFCRIPCGSIAIDPHAIFKDMVIANVVSILHEGGGSLWRGLAQELSRPRTSDRPERRARQSARDHSVMA